MVSIVYDDAYRRYNFGPGHPFSPVRLEMLTGLIAAWDHPLDAVRPTCATREDVLTIHDAAFVAAVEAASSGNADVLLRRFGVGTPDVPAFEGMDEAARRLVGGTLTAARMITSGMTNRVLQLGGGLHHAHRALASGFCVYNDLSVAITHFRDHGLRVAYVDIDVHHGDGVQALHYSDGGVMTISLHESGQYLFPGTGMPYEMGEDAGCGFKLNVPLQPGTTDDSYLEAFDRVVPHALSWFQPDVIVAVCGADAHFRDPLADLLLTTHCYERLFSSIIDLADRYAHGRALFTLAGGYDFDATVRVWGLLYRVLTGTTLPDALPEAWLHEWETRLGRKLTPTLHDPAQMFDLGGAAEVIEQNRMVSRRVIDGVVKYWY